MQKRWNREPRKVIVYNHKFYDYLRFLAETKAYRDFGFADWEFVDYKSRFEF
jgi:hypothetical protein